MNAKILLASFIVLIGCNKAVIQQPDEKIAGETKQSNAVSIGITGDTADVVTTTTAGYVLMGGSTDVDAAIKWMLKRSGGGDVVVIRASGTDAYNDYMYDLYPVNSVETLLIDSKAKANRQSTADKIKKAECVFIAGGDQWDYVKFWKGTLLNDALNFVMNIKQMPVGGTSAGCMILGQYCFDAENGTVTSDEVLDNPYNRYVTFTSHFINIPFLQNIITDTHYDDPNRRGRQTGFMARLFQDSSAVIKGIGVQEETAVAINENGIGQVFGHGKAFFLNAQTQLGLPEVCSPGKKLTWNKNNRAVKVYAIKGSGKGNGSADIVTFRQFDGGSYEYFSADKGAFVVRN